MNMKQSEFSKLLRPHMPALKSTALRMTRSRLDAEDLYQETIFKAFKAFAQFKPNTNFRAWIFRILINSYITVYRKKIRQPQKVSYDNLDEYFLFQKAHHKTSLQGTIDEDFGNNQFEDDILIALNNLPNPFKLVVLLSDVEGFSYNEISSIVNIPLGTVMSRLYRARRLLQRTLWGYAQKNGYINNTTRPKN